MSPQELAAAELDAGNDSDLAGMQCPFSDSAKSSPFIDGHAGFADSCSPPQKLEVCGVVARANVETQIDKEEEEGGAAAATNPPDEFSWPQIDNMIVEWSSDDVDPSRANVEKMTHMLNLAFNKFVDGGLISTPASLENVPTVAQCMEHDLHLARSSGNGPNDRKKARGPAS